MSGVHKYPTISFRISPRQRQEIEAKIFVSGMKKKEYFIHSCIYNRVCVVGKEETVYKIVEKLQEIENNLIELVKRTEDSMSKLSVDDLKGTKEAYLDMLKAIHWMLDGAKYLWEDKKNE